jgi:hypothetical protein
VRESNLSCQIILNTNELENENEHRELMLLLLLSVRNSIPYICVGFYDDVSDSFSLNNSNEKKRKKMMKKFVAPQNQH